MVALRPVSCKFAGSRLANTEGMAGKNLLWREEYFVILQEEKRMKYVSRVSKYGV